MHPALYALEAQRQMTEYFDQGANEHVLRQFYAAFTSDSNLPSISAHFPRPYTSLADLTNEELAPRADAVRLTLAKNMRLAEPYWVQGNMIDLVDHAYASMPAHPMAQETMPVPYGFMYFSRNVRVEADDWEPGTEPNHVQPDLTTGSLSIVEGREPPEAPAMTFSAMSWRRATQVTEDGKYRPGYEIWLYLDRAVIERVARDAIGHPRWSLMTADWMPPYVPTRAMFWADGEISPDNMVSMLDLQVASWLQASVVLMNMPIAARVHAPSDRKADRRMARAALPIRLVTIITMRSPRSKKVGDEPDGEGSGREYTHRWLVDAHWRNQYYPSTGEHKVIYIHVYEKGPDDMPLVIKKKVRAWVR